MSWLRLAVESRRGTAAAAASPRLGQGEDLLPPVGRGARRERKWRKGRLGGGGGGDISWAWGEVRWEGP